MNLDILCFGPHPDDAEIGMGGTLAKHAAMGYRVGIIDLTRGEMSTNGTPEERREEAREAGRILGLSVRENLALPDFGIDPSHDQILKVAAAIRTFRPAVVACPYWEDRHPDHVRASRLLTEGVFAAGLRKVHPESDPHRVPRTLYYFINTDREPTFLVDVSDVYEIKLRSLAAHKSQFGLPGQTAKDIPLNYRGDDTPLTDPRYLRRVRSRDQYFGSLCGVQFAEGFVMRDRVVVPDLMRM